MRMTPVVGSSASKGEVEVGVKSGVKLQTRARVGGIFGLGGPLF
jgi:hypothetical protein